MGALASLFGRRLTVGNIGVGDAPGNFRVLREMKNAAAAYGSIASFKMPSAPWFCERSINLLWFPPLSILIVCFIWEHGTPS